MTKEEYADKFMSRAKQDIKMCENKHELQIYIAGLLENIDYWQNEYDHMKKYRDTLQQENKQLKEKYNKVLRILEQIELLPCESFEDIFDCSECDYCNGFCSNADIKCWDNFIENFEILEGDNNEL